MAKPKAKAEPRGRRSHPQEERVFSVHFLDNMIASNEHCFVPLSDFQKVWKKYIKLFKQYKRETKR